MSMLHLCPVEGVRGRVTQILKKQGENDEMHRQTLSMEAGCKVQGLTGRSTSHHARKAQGALAINKEGKLLTTTDRSHITLR